MTIKILNRKEKATHEIRFRDKRTGESALTTIICDNETVKSLKNKIDEALLK